ncbi:DUF3519 domain-containing protein [Helicobacter pylori]
MPVYTLETTPMEMSYTKPLTSQEVLLKRTENLNERTPGPTNLNPLK